MPSTRPQNWISIITSSPPMFSANENLILREHKRRVVNYVEEAIPEEVLDMGTMVMVMQTACRTPGCVPLETSIAIVFPRVPGAQKELIQGLEDSLGGTFKTRILLPLSEVTKDDVLDSLPPQFNGGRKTLERTCLQARDLVLGRIGGLVGSGDSEAEVEERKILAQYLMQSLSDYLDRNCVAPEPNKPFGLLPVEERGEEENKNMNGNEDNVIQGSIQGSGNFIIRRKDSTGAIQDKKIDDKSILLSSSNQKTFHFRDDKTRSETANDWRRRQNMTKSLHLPSSDRVLERLSGIEHAPGKRSPGCPCCDPENVGNLVDSMLL